MAKQYYQFSKKHFEYGVKGILINKRAGFLEDITDEWLNSGKETWERIYKISTKNRAVDIIIFSSIDMRTNEVREIGADAVRVVTRWTTRRGELFKRVGKHLRIKTLFNNLEKSILKAQGEVFGLNPDEFYSTIRED
jgi:hypothetical protein